MEPRILIEDPAKSYHAAARVSVGDIFDNVLIHGDNLLALKALEADYSRSTKRFDIRSSPASISASAWLTARPPAFSIWVMRSRNFSVAAARPRKVKLCVSTNPKSTDSKASNWRGVVCAGYSRMPKIEAPRVSRRQFRLSHATISRVSMVA